MSGFFAVIPQSGVPTPDNVRERILRGLHVRFVAITMGHATNESLRNAYQQLEIALRSTLIVTEAMLWDITPYLRKAMSASYFVWGVVGDDGFEDRVKACDAAIEELWSFCAPQATEGDGTETVASSDNASK